VRRPDGSWLLRGDPPDAESLARKPATGGQRAQDLMRPARRFAREPQRERQPAEPTALFAPTQPPTDEPANTAGAHN